MNALNVINNIKPYAVIGIIGLAKNTGKTTTLNALITRLQKETIAITSIGLDGEQIDQMTYLPKPKIQVKKGIIVATTTECLKQSQLDYDTLETTSIKTAIGRVIIVKIKSEGNIVVAGPTTNSDLKKVIEKLKKYANKVFVDGAFNRITFANIDCIDGIILATGASVHAQMEKTVAYTKSIIDSFSFEQTIHPIPLQAPLMAQTKSDIYFCKRKTIASLNEKAVKDTLQTLYLKGAITSSLIDGFIKHNYQHFTLVLEDATKLLIPPKYHTYLSNLAINIEVLKAIKLIAVTINPFSPKGNHYQPSAFLKAMQNATRVPVYNVLESEAKYETYT